MPNAEFENQFDIELYPVNLSPETLKYYNNYLINEMNENNH